jgi:hypothetical protein
VRCPNVNHRVRHTPFNQDVPLDWLFRDGVSTPIMPPSSDACLASLGIIGLGLDAHDVLQSLKRQRENTTVPGMR